MVVSIDERMDRRTDGWMLHYTRQTWGIFSFFFILGFFPDYVRAYSSFGVPTNVSWKLSFFLLVGYTTTTPSWPEDTITQNNTQRNFYNIFWCCFYMISSSSSCCCCYYYYRLNVLYVHRSGTKCIASNPYKSIEKIWIIFSENCFTSLQDTWCEWDCIQPRLTLID